MPETFAGKAIKCPACMRAIRVPEIEDGIEKPEDRLDLGNLAAIEEGGQVLERKRKLFQRRMSLKQAQDVAGEPQEIAAAKQRDPNMRVCAVCHAWVRAPDPYVEVICTDCGKAIPSELSSEGALKARYADSLVGRMTTPVTFYTGFLSAVLYPWPAMMWILLGIVVALAAILIPSGIVIGFTAATALNPLSQGSDLGWVGLFLTVMFAAEGAYFGAVNYHILIDSIRTTVAGSEQPPALTFNPTSLGTAVMGYLAIAAYYVAIAAALVFLAHGGIVLPQTKEQFHQLRTPGNLAILALVTFMVPMNVIGLASGRWIDGLNPARVARSILRCISHYAFLFMIVVIFLGFYSAVMMGVVEWAAGALIRSMREGVQKGMITLAWAMIAWAAVIGAGFFFTYSLGRILGLFARTYREHLDFDI